MKIITVSSSSEMRLFARLPKILFAGRPDYIPPLWMDEKNAYSALHNPILAISKYTLLLLLDDRRRPAGRIIAYVDFSYNKFYQTNIGFFGAFDCIDDPAAAGMLIGAAEDWLRACGCTAVRGPINPQAENWGFVCEGYDRPPVYLSPWNPPYYHAFFTAAGYGKAKDLLAYEGDIGRGYRLPARYEGFRESFGRRFPGVTLRRLNTRRIKDDARAIWQISNDALAGNWGYVPLDLAVMEDMLSKLKLIVDPDAVWIAEHEGVAIGYCLGFPDINVILRKTRGRLLPLGWLQLLLGVRKLRDYRLFGLAIDSAWQGRGLDALMYINLYDCLFAKNVRMEANYILEDNLRIRNALEKLGLTQIKSYRIYEKPLSEPAKVN